MRRFLTYIALQANVLNLLLAVALVVLANFTVLPLFRAGAGFRLPGPKGEQAPPREGPAAADFNPADYAVLARENLFHPERKIQPPPKAEEKALPRPDIVLCGTYITSESRLAFIEDKTSPVTSPGRGQRQTVMKLGEKVLGFELKQVEPDRIMLVRDRETMTVYLDAKRQKPAGSGSGTQSVRAPAGQPGSPLSQQSSTGQAGPAAARAGTATPSLPSPHGRP